MRFDETVLPELGACFIHDIETQSDVKVLNDGLDAMGRGHAQSFNLSGNCYSVTMWPDCVTIENEVDTDAAVIQMSHTQYQVILNVWAAFLAKAEGWNKG